MNNRPLPTRFSVKPLALLVPIASLALASSIASADVTVNGTGSYTSVSIIGTGDNNVTVNSSGSIETNFGGPAISVGSFGKGGTLSGGIFNNEGTIIGGGSSYSGTGILLSGSGVTVGAITNTGIIEGASLFGSSNDGISVEIGATAGTISNSGTIIGDVNVYQGGTINGDIINTGLMDGDVFVGDGSEITGSINNSDTIYGGVRIEGSQVAGLENSGVINNGVYIAGSYSGYGGGAIATSLGSLTNSGVIGSVSVVRGASIGEISNTGLIADGIAFSNGSSFTGDIINEGIISQSADGYGYAEVIGAIQIDGSAYGGGELIGADPVTIQGKIVNTSTGSIINDAEPAAIVGIYGGGSLPVKPSVAISDQAAIYLSNVNMSDGIYNEGTISSTSGTGIRVANGSVNTISNDGNISGGNGYGIFIDDTASVSQIVNSGTINGMVDFGTNGGLYKAIGGTSDEILNATSLQIGAATSGAAGALVSTINGNFTFAGPMTFDANGFDGGVRYGQLDASGSATVTGSLNINVSGATFFSNNDVLELIKAGGALTTDIVSAEDNSLLLDFTISTDANSLFATVERDEVVNVVEELFVLADVAAQLGVDITSAGATNTLAIAATLSQIGDLIESGDIPEESELGQTLALLQGIENPVELIQAIQSLEPESGGAGSEGSKAAAGAVSAVIANRISSLRNSAYETGMVAGDDISITGFWIQGYDKDTEQEEREGIDGYDVDMYGIALGADAPVGERTTVGVAISYADSQVDSTGIENNQMGIDSYQISSYISFNEDDYYLDALVSFARNEYDGKRNLFNGLTATSDYTGDQYGARARGGYPFVLESGIHVTPNTSIEYSYLKEEGYSEEGAGNSGLEVDSQSLEALVWAAGVKVAYPFTTESDTTWMPDFHIEVRHDFIGDEVELDTNFVGVGGAGFSTNGASVETTAYKAGIGLRAWSQSSVSFMFRYDYTYKKDYNSQAVAATMRYSF